LALRQTGKPDAERRFVFEVSDPHEAETIVQKLGLAAVIIKRQTEEAHFSQIAEAILSLVRQKNNFVLTGKATSVQYVNGALKAKRLVAHVPPRLTDPKIRMKPRPKTG
jgi:hypothetical protein